MGNNTHLDSMLCSMGYCLLVSRHSLVDNQDQMYLPHSLFFWVAIHSRMFCHNPHQYTIRPMIQFL